MRTFFLTFIFFVFFVFSFFLFFVFFVFIIFLGEGTFFQISTRRPRREWGGRGKKDEDLGGPAKEESKGERPNLGRSDAHRTDTPHDTTTNNTMGDPAQGGFGPPLARFSGVKDGSQRGTKHQEAVWAKRGAGQMWSGKQTKNMEKTRIKNNNQKNVAFLVPSLPFL